MKIIYLHLKLALFELQDIRESDNVEQKTALRKAQNKIDILQHAFNIIGVKGTETDVPATTDPVANAKALDKAEATMAAELNNAYTSETCNSSKENCSDCS